MKRNCSERKETQKKREEKDSTSSNVALIDDEDVYMATTSQECGSDWILDFRCSYHMCAAREQFNNYRACDGGTFRMANGVESWITGVGSYVCACSIVLCKLWVPQVGIQAYRFERDRQIEATSSDYLQSGLQDSS